MEKHDYISEFGSLPCCSDCELSKEDFCHQYINDGKCSHYRKEIREQRKAIVKSINRKDCWYSDMLGQEVTTVGDPVEYFGGMGYHIFGLIGRGILIKDLKFI